MVALATCLRNEAIPMQDLMREVMGRKFKLVLCEDNAAAVTAITSGYSASLRHLARTQRVSLGLLHDTVMNEDAHEGGAIELLKVDTNSHKGDLLTKELEAPKFLAALELARISAEDA